VATVPYDETQQFAADSARAFATIVEGHWDAVFRTLWCMTGNTHDAEELTHETFLKALRAFASFEAGSNVRAWLLRIAVNACPFRSRELYHRRRGNEFPSIGNERANNF
jgi:RNA polymerase sigma factor (sigma-70 family)